MTEEPSGELILYQRDDGAPAMEARLDADTVWLSQQQIAELFQTDRTNIVKHIRNVYDEGELDEPSTCEDFSQVRQEGTRRVTRRIPHYNLDETELKKLNTLVSAYFDAAEFRAQNHEHTYMKGWRAHLDRLIVAMEAPTLPGAGSLSHRQAVTHAEGEYAKYRAQLDATPTEVEEAYLETIRRAQREIGGKQ